MSEKFRLNQAFQDKSILARQLDNAPWVNDKECLMTNPTFLAYIPTGVLPHSIEVESEIRNQTRINSLCPELKYKGKPDLAANGLSREPQHFFPHQREECPPGFQVVNRYNSEHKSTGRTLDQLAHTTPEYFPFTPSQNDNSIMIENMKNIDDTSSTDIYYKYYKDNLGYS